MEKFFSMILKGGIFLNNFEKIQKVVLVNKDRKITISEISSITLIDRSQVRRILRKFDTENKLSEFIVDGRKCKMKSEPINPISDSENKGDIGKNEVESAKGSGQMSYFDLIGQPDSEENFNNVVKRVCSSSEEKKLQPSEESVLSTVNQLNTELKEANNGKATAEKNTLLYSNLFNGKTRKVLFDSSILDLTITQFNSILKKMAREGIKPKFIVFAEDVLMLDLKKDVNYLARELLKFFAQDGDNSFYEIFDGEKPTQKLLGKYCSQYQFILISGNAKNVAWAKLYNAEVIIPEPFLKKIPNPCHGEGVVGLDTCMMSVHQGELKKLLSNYEKILISDIQLEELTGGYLLELIAYYGEVEIASRRKKDKDQSICEFYTENKVTAMYTIDYGCYLFGKVCHINCILYDYSRASESSLLKLASSLFLQYTEIKSGDEIILDQMTNIADNAVMILNEFPNIAIFSPIGQKRENEVRKAFSQDYLTIRIFDIVIIAQIKKRQRALVQYTGQENNTPREYKKFLL